MSRKAGPHLTAGPASSAPSHEADASRREPPPRPTASRPAGPCFWAFVAALVTNFLFFAVHLRYPDLVLHYPFVGGDTQDWIANGLYLAGYDARYSMRPPLLPLVLAGLERISLLELYPLLAQLGMHATLLLFYVVAAARYGSRVALLVSLALLGNYSWQSLSLQVMADVPAACLLFVALALFLAADAEPRRYALAGLAAGASALTQQVAVLFLLPATAAVLRSRAPGWRSPWLAAGLAGFCVPVLAWAGVRVASAATVADATARHWSLLRPHLDGVATYVWALLSFLGWPGALLAALGALVMMRRVRTERYALVVLGTTLLVAGFFVLLYDYDSKRFLAHVFLPCGLLVAEGLAVLPSPTRPLLAVLLLLGSWQPLPTLGSRGSHVALWPWPTLYVSARPAGAATGSARLDFSEIDVERRSGATLIGASNYGRVLAARRHFRPGPALDPEARGDARGALYLHGTSGEEEALHPATIRLGNALRMRAKRLPYVAFRQFFASLAIERVGRFDRWTLYRTRLPELDGSWLLAVASGTEAERELEARAHRAARDATPRDPRAAAARARQIADATRGQAVAILPPTGEGQEERDASLLYLPFVLRTTDLRFVSVEEIVPARRLITASETLAEERVAGVSIARKHILGQEWMVVDYGMESALAAEEEPPR